MRHDPKFYEESEMNVRVSLLLKEINCRFDRPVIIKASQVPIKRTVSNQKLFDIYNKEFKKFKAQNPTLIDEELESKFDKWFSNKYEKGNSTKGGEWIV